MINPLVSICMITYNHEKYIHEAIENVINQKTNFSFELVIGEDCSKDNTRRICERYAEKYSEIIRLLPSEKNLGILPNFIRTMSACKGKYIALCEGDDYWIDSSKLLKQVSFLESHENYSLVHSNYNIFDITNAKMIEKANEKNNHIYNKYNSEYSFRNIFIDILFGKYFIKTCTAVLNGNAALKIIYNNPQLFSEKFLMGDTQLFCEISQLGKIHYINECFAVANKLPLSAKNNTDPFQRILFSKSLGEMAIFLLEKHNYPDILLKGITKQSTFVILNAIKYSQNKWLDETLQKYRDHLSIWHRLLIFLGKYYITRHVTNFILILFRVSKAVTNRISRKLNNSSEHS